VTTDESSQVTSAGLAGPRGVGKTSLIEYFAGRAAGDGLHRPLKVTVAAPVQYEPRDFVLHLFASVCEAVIRERPLRVAHWPSLSRPFQYAIFAVTVLVATVAVLGVDLFTNPRQLTGRHRVHPVAAEAARRRRHTAGAGAGSPPGR
jgi:hypothetical protein